MSCIFIAEFGLVLAKKIPFGRSLFFMLSQRPSSPLAVKNLRCLHFVRSPPSCSKSEEPLWAGSTDVMYHKWHFLLRARVRGRGYGGGLSLASGDSVAIQ